MVASLAMTGPLLAMLLAALQVEDRTPPSIAHTPRREVSPREDLVFEAEIFDQSQVFGPLVYWRPAGTTEWKSLELVKIGGDKFTATLPGQYVTADFEYFLEAYDENGNGPARFAAPEKPYRVTVKVQAAGPVASGPTAPPPPPSSPGPEGPGFLQPWGPYAAMGVGGALLIAGAGLWFAGGAKIADIDARYPNKGMILSAEDRQFAMEASDRTQLGSILMFAGLAGAAGGAAWWAYPRFMSGGAAVHARVDF